MCKLFEFSTEYGMTLYNSFLKKGFIFRERTREGERERNSDVHSVASHMPPTWDLAHIPGMCVR